MEFCKSEKELYRRLLKLYTKQQMRRIMAYLRKEQLDTKQLDWDAQKRSPVYGFKATIGGKRGFVVMSEREALATGIPVDKAIADWVTKPMKKDDKEEYLK